jgi:hypothetical protein
MFMDWNDLIWLKWQYFPNWSTSLINYNKNYKASFFSCRNGKYDRKTHVQEFQHRQNNSEKEQQSWKTHIS